MFAKTKLLRTLIREQNELLRQLIEILQPPVPEGKDESEVWAHDEEEYQRMISKAAYYGSEEQE